MESLIKLTVKTPNQHIDDIQIDCDLQWTVRKLKEYLQDVYPSNPVSQSHTVLTSIFPTSYHCNKSFRVSVCSAMLFINSSGLRSIVNRERE